MDKEDINRMARKAEFGEFVNMITNPLERFANLVAAHEREECAKVCESYQDAVDRHKWPNGYECAAAIRARGEKTDLEVLPDLGPVWASLTNKELETMAEAYVTNCYFDTLKYGQAIQSKLKELNT